MASARRRTPCWMTDLAYSSVRLWAGSRARIDAMRDANVARGHPRGPSGWPSESSQGRSKARSCGRRNSESVHCDAELLHWSPCERPRCTSGMGAAVAERFARLGADVFAAGLRSTETAGFAGHDLHCGGAGHHVSARLGRIHCRTGQPGRPWSTRSGIIRRGDEYTPAVFAADPPSSRGFGWSGKWAACELSVYGHPLPLAQSVDSRPENRVHGVPRR